MLNKILFWLTSIVVLFSFSVSSNAADVKWDMANEYQESSIHGEGQKVFSSVLADKSGGSIVITNHFGGSIGYKSKEHFDAVGDGALHRHTHPTRRARGAGARRDDAHRVVAQLLHADVFPTLVTEVPLRHLLQFVHQRRESPGEVKLKSPETIRK